MHALIEHLERLYRTKGGASYGGEAVTQLEHALQCAALAAGEGASEPLIAACLLHDIGHLLHDEAADVAQRGVDDHHEYRGIHMLRQHFADAVVSPILLHVSAKRYLCAVDPSYWHRLSPASRMSLELQGGPYGGREVQAFICKPFAREAVRLRIWDDLAKVPGAATPDFARFIDLLERCAK